MYRVQTSGIVCLSITIIYSTIIADMIFGLQIQELVSMHLLHRTSPAERIENCMFKCGISFEQAEALAKAQKIPLNDLLWNPA